MPEIPVGPDRVKATQHPDPYLNGDRDFSFETFQLKGEFTRVGLNEDEQRLIFLYRCMKNFEAHHGHQTDTQNGRASVHRAFIQKKSFRHQQRKFTSELVQSLALYRSALEDSPTFFVMFNQESRPGSTINAATLHERNITYQIPRQFSQDILIRNAFEKFISTLAEVSLDCVADFPYRASFSAEYIAKLKPCTIERGVPIVFKQAADASPYQATRTPDASAFTPSVQSSAGGTYGRSAQYSGRSSYASSIPAEFATPKRTGRTYNLKSESVASAQATNAHASGHMGSVSRAANSSSSRARASRASTSNSVAQQNSSTMRTGSIVTVDLSDVDEEFEQLSLSHEEDPFHLQLPGCVCGLPGGRHAADCDIVKSWVYAHSHHC